MLKRINVCLINTLGLVIALFLLLHLLLETKALFERIVQLRISIAEFLATHETLESLAETRSGTMPFGEGGHHLWVADVECGGDAERLDVFAYELVE